MDFVSEYKLYSKIKLGCILSSDIRIEKIMHGSGGSHNIIIKAKYKSHLLIIKIFPRDAHHNTKRMPNFNELEIKFYQFFTQKYLLTNRTPHIVGIYSHTHCPNIDFLIKKKLLDKSCPTYTDQLTKRNLKQSESDWTGVRNVPGTVWGLLPRFAGLAASTGRTASSVSIYDEQQRLVPVAPQRNQSYLLPVRRPHESVFRLQSQAWCL